MLPGNYFKRLKKKVECLSQFRSGFVQDEIAKVADAKKKDFAKRKSVLVGTNMYANPKEEPLEIKQPDYDSIYKKRVEYIQKYRVNGDDKKHSSILDKLQQTANTKSYDMINQATDAYLEGASLGEISKSIRASSEKGINVKPLSQFRIAEMFEELRIASENYKMKTGSKPKSISWLRWVP